jgi:hypothetical protein
MTGVVAARQKAKASRPDRGHPPEITGRQEVEHVEHSDEAPAEPQRPRRRARIRDPHAVRAAAAGSTEGSAGTLGRLPPEEGVMARRLGYWLLLTCCVIALERAAVAQAEADCDDGHVTCEPAWDGCDWCEGHGYCRSDAGPMYECYSAGFNCIDGAFPVSRVLSNVLLVALVFEIELLGVEKIAH